MPRMTTAKPFSSLDPDAWFGVTKAVSWVLILVLVFMARPGVWALSPAEMESFAALVDRYNQAHCPPGIPLRGEATRQGLQRLADAGLLEEGRIEDLLAARISFDRPSAARDPETSSGLSAADPMAGRPGLNSDQASVLKDVLDGMKTFCDGPLPHAGAAPKTPRRVRIQKKRVRFRTAEGAVESFEYYAPEVQTVDSPPPSGTGNPPANLTLPAADPGSILVDRGGDLADLSAGTPLEVGADRSSETDTPAGDPAEVSQGPVVIDSTTSQDLEDAERARQSAGAASRVTVSSTGAGVTVTVNGKPVTTGGLSAGGGVSINSKVIIQNGQVIENSQSVTTNP